jgi:hypothetical protein
MSTDNNAIGLLSAPDLLLPQGLAREKFIDGLPVLNSHKPLSSLRQPRKA